MEVVIDPEMARTVKSVTEIRYVVDKLWLYKHEAHQKLCVFGVL